MKKGSSINLRLLTEQDIEWSRKLRNDNHDKFFDAGYITKEQQKAWYSRYVDNYGRDYFFVICKKDGTRVGTIAIYNINIADRTADIGRITIMDEFQGNGYMKEAIDLASSIAFEDMRLHKLRLAVHLDNVQAISLYAKTGFKTMTRPVILMEKSNRKFDPTIPLTLESYDDWSGSYESEESNIA